MTTYTCPRCLKTFSQKHFIARHFDSKYNCKKHSDGIDLNQDVKEKVLNKSLENSEQQGMNLTVMHMVCEALFSDAQYVHNKRFKQYYSYNDNTFIEMDTIELRIDIFAKMYNFFIKHYENEIALKYIDDKSKNLQSVKQFYKLMKFSKKKTSFSENSELYTIFMETPASIDEYEECAKFLIDLVKVNGKATLMQLKDKMLEYISRSPSEHDEMVNKFIKEN